MRAHAGRSAGGGLKRLLSSNRSHRQHTYHHGVLGHQPHGLRALIGQLAGHLEVDGGVLRVGFGDSCGYHSDGGRALRQDGAGGSFQHQRLCGEDRRHCQRLWREKLTHDTFKDTRILSHPVNGAAAFIPAAALQLSAGSAVGWPA